ncbi:MAG: hypothetical protein ACE5KM_18040 [Planctomycetaceae bacterium]
MTFAFAAIFIAVILAVSAVVVALCVGALALLNAVLNPPRRIQAAQPSAVEAVRAMARDLRFPPAPDFAADSVTMTAIAQ